MHVVEERIDRGLRVCSPSGVSGGTVPRSSSRSVSVASRPSLDSRLDVARVAPGSVSASAASVAIVSTSVLQDAMLAQTSSAHASSASVVPPPPQPAAASRSTSDQGAELHAAEISYTAARFRRRVKSAIAALAYASRESMAVN